MLHCKYFTARVKGGRGQRRQSKYLQVLDAQPNLEVIYGRYAQRNRFCNICRNNYSSPEEKMTDVNIAVNMVADAYNNRFDRAILISGDTDLIAPIREVINLGKQVIVAFPPGSKRSQSGSLKREASNHFTIGESKIKNSLLPDKIIVDGFEIEKPSHWA